MHKVCPVSIVKILNVIEMAKTQKKPTNKAKFSLYLDKGIMAKVAKIAVQEQRSINFITERILKASV